MEKSPLEVRAFEPSLWPDLETLFGPEGASDGCWCMSWRSLKEIAGEPARLALRAFAESGGLRGALAFADGEAVGWCAFGPRSDFPQAVAQTQRVERAPPDAWAIPCFFVRDDWRGRGVARALLAKALDELRAAGAPVAEGYPVPADATDPVVREAWSFIGPACLFAECGFDAVEGVRLGDLEYRLKRLDEPVARRDRAFESAH